MTPLNSTSLREIFQEALKEDKDFIKELLERLLQEFMEEERNQQVGVSSYVRDKSIRKATRNGYKSLLTVDLEKDRSGDNLSTIFSTRLVDTPSMTICWMAKRRALSLL